MMNRGLSQSVAMMADPFVMRFWKNCVVFFQSQSVRRDRMISFIISFLLHVTVFFVGGNILIEQAQYGVQIGERSIEVNLVAAIPEAVNTKPPLDIVETPKDILTQDADLIIPQEVKSESKPQAIVPEPQASISTGQDELTAQSDGGAWQKNTPSYLKNPPPVYPRQAERARQEGLVVLHAIVNSQGRVNEIHVKQSSGFPLLDESALKAVRYWKFHPARLGQLPIDSEVEIPVRFQLK